MGSRKVQHSRSCSRRTDRQTSQYGNQHSLGSHMMAKLSRQRHFESGYFVRVNGRIEAAFISRPYAIEYVETRKAGGSGARFEVLDCHGTPINDPAIQVSL